MEVYELSERIKKLDTSERMMLIQEVFKDDSVSVTELLVSKLAHLENFKVKAKEDIRTVATAGIELGEREMRRVTKIKGNTRRKDDSFYLAMTKCLIDAGAYEGTQYIDKIESADFSSVDDEWYEWTWKPKTSNRTLKGELE